MAVVDLLSAELTNIDADPTVAQDAINWHGRLRIKSAIVEMASGDTDASIYRFVRVKSTDSLKSIKLFHDSITGANDIDCGLYTVGSGGAAVDADLYADGFTIAVLLPAVPHVLAETSYLELRFGVATTAAINDINNRVWEDLGATSDTGLSYDLCLTGNTVGSTGGTMAMLVEYTAGD